MRSTCIPKCLQPKWCVPFRAIKSCVPSSQSNVPPNCLPAQVRCVVGAESLLKRLDGETNVLPLDLFRHVVLGPARTTSTSPFTRRQALSASESRP